MRKCIFFIIIAFCACQPIDEVRPPCMEEGCAILNDYSFSVTPLESAVELNYGISSIIDGFGKTCYPDALDFYISEDDVDYSKVARVEADTGELLIDELENGKEYFLKMVNIHCELDSVVSPIISVFVGDIPMPRLIDNPMASASITFEDFRLSADGDRIIYRGGADDWYVSSLSNLQKGDKVASDAFHAQWSTINPEAFTVVENTTVNIQSSVNGITSKYLLETDLSAQGLDTLHDILTPHNFDHEVHHPEQYWIHEFRYALDGKAIYFITNKDNGSSSTYEKAVFDNIWKLDLSTKEIGAVSDFLPIKFDVRDFVEDPKQPGNFYLIGGTEKDRGEVEETGIHYFDTTSKMLTSILINNHIVNHLSIDPSGDNLLFVSNRSGTNEVWSHRISDQRIKQITNSKDYYPSFRWQHLNWANDREFITCIVQNNTTKFAQFSID